MITWSQKYEIGIPAIDTQHKRIVEYINLLRSLDEGGNGKNQLSSILNLLIEYTHSHFEFEEELMEIAEYAEVDEHKKNHMHFRKEIDHLHQLFNNGEDIAQDLSEMLQNWLLQHIMEDDASYVESVKDSILAHTPQAHQKWEQRATQRYFKRW